MSSAPESLSRKNRGPEEPATMSQTEDKHVHHSMDYIEFTVTDLPLAKQFFSKAFGWEFTDYAPVYAGIKGPDREVGGLTVGEVQPGGPLVVLYSGDLEDTLEKVESAGGRIVKDIFDFPGGRRFHFQTPSGNEMAVWGFSKV